MVGVLQQHAVTFKGEIPGIKIVPFPDNGSLVNKRIYQGKVKGDKAYKGENKEQKIPRDIKNDPVGGDLLFSGSGYYIHIYGFLK
jgi:hypothetical protein